MKIDTVTPGRLQTLTCRLAASLGWATSGEPNSRPNKPSPHLSALHLPSRLEESPFAPGLAGKPTRAGGRTKVRRLERWAPPCTCSTPLTSCFRATTPWQATRRLGERPPKSVRSFVSRMAACRMFSLPHSDSASLQPHTHMRDVNVCLHNDTRDFDHRADSLCTPRLHKALEVDPAQLQGRLTTPGAQTPRHQNVRARLQRARWRTLRLWRPLPALLHSLPSFAPSSRPSPLPSPRPSQPSSPRQA